MVDIPMQWNYSKTPMPHWTSAFPDGFFIVEEEKEEGGSEYVVYEGNFSDWHLLNADELTERERFEDLEAAKKFTP